MWEGCLLWRTVGDREDSEVGSSVLHSAEALSAHISSSQAACWGFMCFIIRVKNV